MSFDCCQSPWIPRIYIQPIQLSCAYLTGEDDCTRPRTLLSSPRFFYNPITIVRNSHAPLICARFKQELFCKYSVEYSWAFNRWVWRQLSPRGVHFEQIYSALSVPKKIANSQKQMKALSCTSAFFSLFPNVLILWTKALVPRQDYF